MDMKLKNKVAIITGSSKGIGKATALLFAKEGAKVVVNYSKSKKEADEVVSQINKISEAIAIKSDVSEEKQAKELISKTIDKFGKLDILVNNVGKYIDGDEWDGNSKVWKETLNHNLISAMNTSKYAIKIFQKQKSGVIVNISSRHSLSGSYEELAYAVSKSGIVSITQAYSKLLAPFGRANAVSPGATNAGYWLRAPKDELDAAISKMPNKKLIEPEEIAQTILFLASDESSRINGQNILVNNGK